MSDLDKMVAFGSWLSSKKVQHTAELYALSVNVKAPIDALRIKAGHVEATSHILEAFSSLYNGDINKFMREYLGQEPEEEEKEVGGDGPGKGST
jgi:hypothetical protein